MTDPADTPRLRPDGTFDTAYYLQRGREMRSHQTLDMMRTPARRPHGPITLLLALIALPFASLR